MPQKKSIILFKPAAAQRKSKKKDKMSKLSKIQTLPNTVVEDMLKEFTKSNYDEHGKEDQCKQNGSTGALANARVTVTEENSLTNIAREGHRRHPNKAIPKLTSQDVAKSNNGGNIRRDPIENEKKSLALIKLSWRVHKMKCNDIREQCEEDICETGKREHICQHFQTSSIDI